MSDLYEFFKLITIFANPMWKSWLLMAKLGVCIPLGKHLVISTIFLLEAKNCLKWVWESTQFVFLTMKSAVEPNRLLMKFLLCHVDIQEKKNFLGITWESKRSWRRPYLMMLYVIFPIHVNFPISSKCVLKATVHRKKNSQLFYITWEVFLFIKRCFYDTVHACCIWLIIPFHHYHLSIIFVI